VIRSPLRRHYYWPMMIFGVWVEGDPMLNIFDVSRDVVGGRVA
jgi:hypothetical protein